MSPLCLHVEVYVLAMEYPHKYVFLKGHKAMWSSKWMNGLLPHVPFDTCSIEAVAVSLQ